MKVKLMVEREADVMAADERDHYDNKGDKTGRSAEEEGLFGDKRTQHYDESGGRTGKSRKEKGLFGEERVQHYDETGERTGRSEAKTGMFGDEYTQHYDETGEKAGRSRAEKGIFGDEYVQHYNAQGDKTGRTRVDQEARRREEREQRSRESLEQATRAYQTNGALKLKDLRNVAWGPTLKLSFWRGMASGAVLMLIVPFLASGSFFERLLAAPLIGLAWGLTAWYGAPLNYILWRGIGAVLGPMTMGIGYIVANFGLLVLALIMSLGDPIIYYVHRRYPHFFELDDYKPFTLKSLIFITNGPSSLEPILRREERVERERDVEERQAQREYQREATTVERTPERPATSQPQGQQAPSYRIEPTEVDRAYDTKERKRKGLPVRTLVFVVLIAVSAAVGYVVFTRTPSTQSASNVSNEPVAPEQVQPATVEPITTVAAPTVITCDQSNCRDIWTTSVYSFAPEGGGPGGGLDDERLRVGGFGDEYWSLIRIELPANATETSRATLELYNRTTEQPTDFYLDEVVTDWGWAPGDRLWWRDRPQTQNLTQITVLDREGWVRVDITELYNGWVRGERANYGLALRPVSTNNTFDEFVSSNSPDAELRPRVVVE